MEGFLGLIESERINVRNLIGGEFPMESAPEAYAYLGKQSKVAIILSYPTAVEKISHPTVYQTSTGTPVGKTAKQIKVVGKINVALVGPGSFAKEILIPTLRKNSANFNLRWVVSSNPLHASQIARRYHFEKFTCNYDDILKEPDVHLVVIAAPNNLHYSMVMSAMKAEKPVFVEKPLCLTMDELEDIKRVENESQTPLFVGFNRRYAPQIVKIKDVMQSRRSIRCEL